MKLARGVRERQRRLQLAEIRADDRLQVGVERGCGEPLELADLGEHFVRGARVFVGPQRANLGECCPFVLGVGVGVDEDDRDALCSFFQKQPRSAAHLRRIDAASDGPIRERPLVDLDAQVAFGDRDKIAPQPPGPAAVAAAHFQHVAEAACRDHPDARAAPLQDCVGADRRAVHDRALGDRPVESPQRGKGIEETPRFIAAMGWDLARAERAVCWIEHEQIGESAAHVDADDDARAGHRGVPAARAREVACASSAPSECRMTL